MGSKGSPAIYDTADNDLEQVDLDFGLDSYEGLEGWRLVSQSPENMEVWNGQKRTPLDSDHDETARTHTWEIDSGGVDAPEAVYAEGTETGSRSMSWTLEKPNGEPGEGCRPRFEVLQGMEAPPLARCPECGGPCHRVFSPFATIRNEQAMLRPKNLERLGFTQFKRAGDGYYEKTCGEGPRELHRDP